MSNKSTSPEQNHDDIPPPAYSPEKPNEYSECSTSRQTYSEPIHGPVNYAECSPSAPRQINPGDYLPSAPTQVNYEDTAPNPYSTYQRPPDTIQSKGFEYDFKKGPIGNLFGLAACGIKALDRSHQTDASKHVVRLVDGFIQKRERREMKKDMKQEQKEYTKEMKRQMRSSRKYGGVVLHRSDVEQPVVIQPFTQQHQPILLQTSAQHFYVQEPYVQEPYVQQLYVQQPYAQHQPIVLPQPHRRTRHNR